MNEYDSMLEELVDLGLPSGYTDPLDIRQFLGLSPSSHVDEEPAGLTTTNNDIVVKLVYSPSIDPLYDTIYRLVRRTWGYANDHLPTPKLVKWVVENPVLLGMTQPMALEVPVFVFSVENAPRSTMDQLFRTRIGAAFSARGERDNDCRHQPFVVPKAMHWNEDGCPEKWVVEEVMDIYADAVDRGASWQTARALLPMGLSTEFMLIYNWQSLRNMMGSRLALCEQPETVETVWRMVDAIRDWHPEWGRHLLPACVHAQRCLYADGGMKSLFSNLHDYAKCPLFHLLHPLEHFRLRGDAYFRAPDNLALETWESNHPKHVKWVQRYIDYRSSGKLSVYETYREGRRWLL